MFSTTFCIPLFKKNIFRVMHSVNWPNVMVWLTLLLEIWGNMCIVTACCLVCDVTNFEIILCFLYGAIFPHDQKSKYKNLNILRTKRTLKMKSKGFCTIFKEISLKQIRATSFREREYNFNTEPPFLYQWKVFWIILHQKSNV